jgi:hypothetical protein
MGGAPPPKTARRARQLLADPATRARYTKLARQAGVPLRQYVVREQLRHHD